MTTIDRIIKLQEKSGLTVKDFEKQVGLSNGVIGQWRKGLAKLPSTEAIIKISRFCGVSTDYILCQEINNTEVNEMDYPKASQQAVTDFQEWLEDHGYEVIQEDNDKGSGTIWHIEKNGKSIPFSEPDFVDICVSLSHIMKTPEDIVYKDWLIKKFGPQSADEYELLEYYREMEDNHSVHKFMSGIYDLFEQIKKEKTDPQRKSAI